MTNDPDASTAEEPSPAAPAPAPSEPPTGFGRIWARFRRSRGARIGLFLVVLFSLIALFAPFIAHRLPFVWRDGATGAYSFPLVREFFAPSDTTEAMLERGINFLFLYIPVGYIALRLMRRFAPGLERTRSRLVSLAFGLLVSLALWLSIGGMVMDAGGGDWLHREVPPVPETDDLVRPETFWTEIARHNGGDNPILLLPEDTFPAPAPETDARRQAAWALVEPGLRTALESAVFIPPATDSGKRLVLEVVQRLVDSPPLASPDAARGAGVEVRGITGATVDQGINTPRLNRFLVEAAFPGLLTPMRQFRSTFILMAVASLAVLLGLTYICLAGAWQFSLSPRWLVMLLLAALLSLAFRAPVRHDHTPYRQMAAAGDGWGVFPLVPYGPNEQGFGPRLPPTWRTERPELTLASVVSWQHLIASLDKPATPLAKRLAALLEQALPDWRSRTADETGRERVVAALNRIIGGDELHDGEAVESLRGDAMLLPYLAEVRGGRPLADPHRRRMNRLLVERALAGSVESAAAARWKKPRHSPGYHLAGTDESGRDVLVRMIHGARVSLSVGFVSVFLATVLGLVMGALAAYYAGRVDIVISRFMEILMCFPSFFLILAVIAVLDRRSIINIMLVIGLTSWTGVARLVRGEMLRQKKMEYVAASVALGASDTRTIFRHILPNAMAPVLVSISFGITGAILTEAGLSFIGFGVTPPTPTWGQLLSETRDSPLANWWLAVFPGLILFFSVLAYNMVGEGLRDALDPRSA